MPFPLSQHATGTHPGTFLLLVWRRFICYYLPLHTIFYCLISRHILTFLYIPTTYRSQLLERARPDHHPYHCSKSNCLSEPSLPSACFSVFTGQLHLTRQRSLLTFFSSNMQTYDFFYHVANQRQVTGRRKKRGWRQKKKQRANIASETQPAESPPPPRPPCPPCHTVSHRSRTKHGHSVCRGARPPCPPCLG